jgi:hypothetical protein
LYSWFKSFCFSQGPEGDESHGDQEFLIRMNDAYSGPAGAAEITLSLRFRGHDAHLFASPVVSLLDSTGSDSGEPSSRRLCLSCALRGSRNAPRHLAEYDHPANLQDSRLPIEGQTRQEGAVRQNGCAFDVDRTRLYRALAR